MIKIIKSQFKWTIEVKDYTSLRNQIGMSLVHRKFNFHERVKMIEIKITIGENQLHF
jgi:hypothetical protein